MQRDDLHALRLMLASAEKVVQRLEGLDRDAFDADELIRAGLAYWLQNIGEAARYVSGDIRARHPGIPWVDIVGMRHNIVHEYFRVDFELVWETATADVPPLIPALQSALSAEERRQEGPA